MAEPEAAMTLGTDPKEGHIDLSAGYTDGDIHNPAESPGRLFLVKRLLLCLFRAAGRVGPADGHLPLAKITAGFAALGLLASAGRTKRSFKDLPREASYLLP